MKDDKILLCKGINDNVVDREKKFESIKYDRKYNNMHSFYKNNNNVHSNIIYKLRTSTFFLCISTINNRWLN